MPLPLHLLPFLDLTDCWTAAENTLVMFVILHEPWWWVLLILLCSTMFATLTFKRAWAWAWAWPARPYTYAHGSSGTSRRFLCSLPLPAFRGSLLIRNPAKPVIVQISQESERG